MNYKSFKGKVLYDTYIVGPDLSVDLYGYVYEFHALTGTGVRLYYTTAQLNGNPSQTPYQLTLLHVRLPPGFAANATVYRPTKVHKALYSHGKVTSLSIFILYLHFKVILVFRMCMFRLEYMSCICQEYKNG